MRALWSLIPLVGLVGCYQDILLNDKDKGQVVPNPPDLQTPSKTDKIVQVTTPKVDVLWVIDNSCSMSEEQAKLTRNFPKFIAFFLDSGLDWHIGVVTTDTVSRSESGKLQGASGYRYLDADSPNPEGLFSQMATLGTSGSYDEMGRRATYQALTDPNLSGYNSGFYRDEASLNVIIISDEEDSSGSNPSRNEFITFMRGLKADPTLVTFSSIVGPQGGCATAVAGTEYLAVTNAIGGVTESICKEDWEPVLTELGLQAAGLKREYFLSELPVEGTIEVEVIDGEYAYLGFDVALLGEGETRTDVCPDCGFSYEYNPIRNSIVMLDYVPSPLASINITYELLSGFQPSDDTDAP